MANAETVGRRPVCVFCRNFPRTPAGRAPSAAVWVRRDRSPHKLQVPGRPS